MSTTAEEDAYAPRPEQFLSLSDGRTLAYCETGISTSLTVVLFLHGLSSVGYVDNPAPVFKEKGVHYIAPTLPGFGLSDSRPKDKGTYAQTLCKDMCELLNHLHPNNQSALRVFVAGGSYGTVPAQILYGAPFDLFPLGRQVVGCLLLGPLSPFKDHTGYAKSMNWLNYITVGPVSQALPFIPRALGSVIKKKLKTVEDAEGILRQTLWGRMGAEEKATFDEWKETQGLGGGKYERSMAERAYKSATKTMDGFIEVSSVLHSDWGYIPNQLDDEHNSRPIWILAGKQDALGTDIPTWLGDNYKNSKLLMGDGSHAFYRMHETWRDFMEGIDDETTPDRV